MPDSLVSPLHNYHTSRNAKFIDFAGWSMPFSYEGTIKEHNYVREDKGFFDVSHMGRLEIQNNDIAILQTLICSDIENLQVGKALYTIFTNNNGCAIDDVVFWKFQDKILLICNAANTLKIKDHLITYSISFNDVTNSTALIAIQGPNAIEIMEGLVDIPDSFSCLQNDQYTYARTGYTGEPGFELCFPVEYSEQVWKAIMSAGAEFDIEPIGLASRDTLRLEMKYCLYGNDIDETTNPIEAGLGWITKVDKGDFIGVEAIRKVKEQGVSRRLVAFQLEGKGFPRHGYKIFKDSEEIGYVTSGTFSPMLEKGIGMGYVANAASKVGTTVDIEIRGKRISAILIKPPFYKKEKIDF